MVNKAQPKKVAGSARLFSADGTEQGNIVLPQSVTTAKVNATLLAQAVRVYLANRRQGSAATKTRGEVEGSTRKIYKQKGTGRARHGAIRAPIFVGGGIVFGPKPRDYGLELTKSMRTKALLSALSNKYKESSLVVIEDLENTQPKTKVMAGILHKVAGDTSSTLVVGSNAKTTVRAARNISNIDIIPAASLNAYDVVSHAKMIITKPGLKVLEERLTQ